VGAAVNAFIDLLWGSDEEFFQNLVENSCKTGCDLDRSVDPNMVHYQQYTVNLFYYGSILAGTGAAATLKGTAPVATGTAQAGEAFHYTFSRYLQSISKNGLRQGTYATGNGTLSPLQAQIELALPANRGLPGALVRIDLAGMRAAGYEIPAATRVSSRFGLPGGGYEMQFNYPIPPQFITVVP
jgi:hypothetical protein